MEVLAPAGSAESFKAALLAGADAIYLGGPRFGARRFAQNFQPEEMAGAVELAHGRGVKVYVTVNTLIKEAEMAEALAYVSELQGMGVDAVIVQDRGLASVLLKRSGMPVHASTQMGIHTPEGARWAEGMGFERVILARELSLADIARIRDASEVGLEVFVHGALCYCFSGQCLFSSFAGGRSGNRGACAQPCRKLYSMAQEQGYLLSTADLFCADALPELLSLEVASIKIEGRMRGPIYTYLATKTYKSAVRRAENGEAPLVTEREREMLAVAFNRGFTPGYLMEGEVMQRRHPDPRGLVLGEVTAKDGVLSPYPEGAFPGDGITIYREGDKVGGFEVTRAQAERRAMKAPFPLPDGRYTLHKTKDRGFAAIEAELAGLQLHRRQVRPAGRGRTEEGKPRPSRPPQISAMVSSLKALDAVLPHVDRVYYEMVPRMDEALERCRDQGVELATLLPRVSPTIPDTGNDPLMVCSPDQAFKYQGRKLYGHYSLNVFNSQALEGLHQCMASVELSRQELLQLLQGTSSRIEVLAYGRVELMVSKDPSLAQGVLRDPKGLAFQTYRDQFGYVHILNSADILLLEQMDELEAMGVDSVALDLRRRPPELAALTARAFRQRDASKRSAIKRRSGAVTMGHYLQGVD